MNRAGLTYDTGALVAAERNEDGIWRLHRTAVRRGTQPVVPAGVLAQAWRGGPRQYWLARFLAHCDIEPLDERLARQVGVICHQHAVADVVDVSVVAGALRRGDEIVTRDIRDVMSLARAMGVRVRSI